MEDINKVCPTEILIDLNDDTFLSCMNSKKTCTASDYYKPEIYLKKEKEQEGLQSILDVSPFRINEEHKDANLNVVLGTDMEQCLKLKEVVDDCPTAILVDVPSTSSFSLKQHFISDLKDKVSTNFFIGNCSEEDSSDYSPKPNETFIQRKHWKTPSPQSMSLISTEASRVIHNLNSSAIFDDDSLLTEEIPLNFDNLDLEDCIEQEDTLNTENACGNKILNSLVNVKTQNMVNNAKKFEEGIDDYASFPESELFTACKNFHDSSIKLSLETSISKVSLEDFKERDSNSEELFLSEIHSDSLNNSKFSANSDGMDDVFIAKKISSEDKENKQRREHVTLYEDMKLSSKTPCKKFFPSKSKEFRGTLRNLSNVTPEVTNSTRLLSYNPNKNMTTPCRKMSSASKMKEIQPSTGKLQMKKTVSTFESTRASSGQKSWLTTKNAPLNSNPLCKPSDFKQLTAATKIKTPIRRYSVSTPLKGDSAMKPPLNTALHSFQNHPIPRYTPQSVGNSHFSFSKSWQQPTNSSNFLNSKGVKEQNNAFTGIPTNTSKVSSGRLNLFNQRRQSFSQSMSAASFRSLGKDALPTSSKIRFCSKLNLPSPLPIGQERKLARALFPSVSKK